MSGFHSPLAVIFLDTYVSALVRETVRYQKKDYADLAKQVFIPQVILMEAVAGHGGLRRGQWRALFTILNMSMTFASRQTVRYGEDVWELWSPPVSSIETDPSQ